MNKILIIDDDVQIRENIQLILDLKGFSTLTAENGLQGLQMAQQYQPDIILCDLMMPELNGYELIKALRQEPKTVGIPFIFLTAKAEYSHVREGMKLGADDYLTKPFEVQELLRVISVRLEKSQIIAQRYQSQIQQMEAEINYLARHDSLTDLPNQFFLEEIFNKICVVTYNHGLFLPLLLIDIDILYHAKLFQPNLRQLLLKSLAERLNLLNCSHQMIDLVAYLKTDQLVLLLKPVETNKFVAKIAEEILESLSKPVIFNKQEIFIQAKIGISCYPNDGLQISELLTHAEVTLEHYKLDNRTSYHFYNQEIFNIVCRKIILETDFAHAIEKNEFQLYYQPQININTGKVVGIEALIRWEHPKYGIVSPGEFIPLAEESGFIIPLGEWILRTACLQLNDLKAEGLSNLNVAVNISACQLKEENFVQHTKEIIAQTNFNPEFLELELTETVFIQDTETVKQKINQLRDAGIKLSIDDFGTGYSSFKYLQEFSFSNLKIDRYFISNIDQLEKKQSIVKSIIQLAANLNINIIAEGVETKDELTWLKQNSCSFVQGYFFSRPLAIEDLKIFLKINY